MAVKQVCAVTEPATLIDACMCMSTDRYKCNMPDSTCRHRAVIAGSGPQTVQKAHAYDVRLAAAADKKKNEQLENCKTQRPRCPHKTTKVPPPPDADQTNGQTPAGDGGRAECEIAKQDDASRLEPLSQPISNEPWKPPPDYERPPNNNDRNYNVIGQRVLRVPPPPRALPLSQLGADSKANRGKSRYNVIGQRLLDPRHICIREPYVDRRPYNVIGQPCFPPIPPPPPKVKPPDPLCLCTPMAL